MLTGTNNIGKRVEDKRRGNANNILKDGLVSKYTLYFSSFQECGLKLFVQRFGVL